MLKSEIEEIKKKLAEYKKNKLFQIHKSILNTKILFDVELTNHCNLECIMCPRNQILRPKGIMEPNTFNKLSKWLPNKVNVMFSGMGEPLLNPYITSYIRTLKKKGIYVGITSNGLLLNDKKALELIDAGIDFIQVSLHGLSEPVYDSIVKGGNLNLLIKNLEFLSKINKNHLTIQLSVVEQESNKKEIFSIKKFAEKLGFTYFPRRIHTRGGHLARNPSVKGEIRGCGILAKVMYIAWDGSILACCHDLHGERNFGNIRSVSFKKIIELKKETILKDDWLTICPFCDDDYRYLLLIHPEII